MKQLSLPEKIKWIGTESGEDFPIETVYFKHVFELEKEVTEAKINISANTRYCLYINGIEIVDGPCRGDHWHQYCDHIEIASYLKPGKNIIAVKVIAFPPYETMRDDQSNFGPFWAMTDSSGPMLIVQGMIDSNDISTGVADWYYLKDSAISWVHQHVAFWMGCHELVDGAKLPWGWQTDEQIGDDFKPALIKWDNTVDYGEVYPLFLYERPIKSLIRKELDALTVLTASDGLKLQVDQEKVVLEANKSYEMILDAGQLTTAYVYFRFLGGLGSKIQMTYSEGFSKSEGGRRYKEKRSDISGDLLGVTDVYLPSGGDESYSPFWFRTFRFIKLQIETGDTPLTIYPLNLLETRYPLENKVTFKAKEPWVGQIWDISQRTLELCMHETYEDCPFYEQLQYTMDTRLQILFTYCISNDTSMSRRTIHDYHTSMLPEGILQSRFPSKHTQVIPVFALHWIFMLQDYYMETGDISILERYRPTAESILGWFKRHVNEQGLIENLDYWDFADWTEAWDHRAGVPNATQHGPSTIQNLVYAYALGKMTEILTTLNLSQLANRYQDERLAIIDQIQARCWSEEKGLYKDGPDFEEYTQHAQLWAVLNGLATGEKAKQIMRKALADPTLIPCSFVLQFYLFRALEQAGMYEETESQWDLWKELIELDLTTVPEIPGKYTRSDCHAWGSLLLHELPRKFLGVAPLEPGYTKIAIQPKGMYMKELSGSVPTPFGEVAVSWSKIENRFRINGTTPVPAEITLPDGSVYQVEAGDFSYEVVVD